MHVTGDRQVEHGLSTVGFDDEGVAAQTWDLIRDGVLVGYQLDRRTAALVRHRAVERLRLRRLAAARADPADGERQPAANRRRAVDRGDLIAGVEDGLYVVGDKSWSIDMQRYNFQFTGQRFFRIKNGQLAGQVRDAAYQATTTDFWRSMSAVGGPQTYVLGGAFNCGKGQPGQTAAVSHGCPSALFNGVRILNTTQEARQVSAALRPQELVERALAASTTDSCVVIASDNASTNLRWANNTLTTNGVTQTVNVTVVATIDGSDGVRSGSVSRNAIDADSVVALVAEAEANARGSAARRRRRRARLTRPVAGLGRNRARTRRLRR